MARGVQNDLHTRGEYYGLKGRKRAVEAPFLRSTYGRRYIRIWGTCFGLGKPELMAWGVQNDLHMRGEYYNLKNRKRAVEASFLRSTCRRCYIRIGETWFG